jgi:isopenicillin-N N-acyltransferase like protein
MSARGKWIAGGAFGLLLLAGVFVVWGVDAFFSPRPPAWDGDRALLTAAPVADAAGTTRLGQSFCFDRGGIHAASLAGTPSEQGLAMGRLFDLPSQRVERSLLATVRRFIPWEPARWLLARFVLIRNRHLDRYLPTAVLAEMHGLALGSTDLYPQYGAHYARLLNYLAAHDLSHALMDDKTLAGCTALGATTRATGTGQVLLARNFDFEAGEAFDVEKVVARIQPAGGHAFLSVAWPGMFGVVSGLNDAGIGVVLLAGHSADKPGVGTPVSVVARELLERAGSLDEAVAVIREAKVFVSEIFLVGSGPENLFVAVEKTPGHCALRGRGEAAVLAANHFLTPELKNDPKNLAYLRAGTTQPRWSRLNELVQAGLGRLDVPRCVALLRDRRAPRGGSQGLGNRQAINALIAAHAVVMDLKNKIVWVAAAPHQLGAFVPFALDDLAAPVKEPWIPADELLRNGQYEKFLRYRADLERGEGELKAGRYQEALSYFIDARSLNPDHYRSYLLAAKALLALKRPDEARYNFEQSLIWHPAFPAERREAEQALKRLAEVQP